MITLIFAFILIFLSLVSFGQLIVGYLKIEFTALEKLSFGLIFAICLITPAIVFLGLLVGPSAYLILIPACIVGLKYFKSTTHLIQVIVAQGLKKRWTALFLIFSTIALISTISLSGVFWNGNLYFQEVHDSVWHLSLIKNLQLSIPPQHPSHPIIILQNYHYFYDALLAGIVYLTTVSPSILYFQIFPLILSFLLVSQTYLLGRKLLSESAGHWLVFFTIFGGSFAYLIPLFLPGQAWHESSFWVSQTFVMMVNPQIIFSLALTFSVLSLLTQFKDNSRIELLIIFLIASSIGFKSYSWVVLSAIYATHLLVKIVKKRDLRLAIWGVLFLIISLPFIWLITGFETGSFFYEPLWFVNTMIESPDRVNHIIWKFMEDHYLYTKNWPRLIWLKTREILIFFFGNLGTRSVFVLLPAFLLKKKKSFLNGELLLLCLIGFLFSSIFPLLFLQRGIVWNSIQFWYYALIFANILVSILLSKLFKNISQPYKILIIFLMIIATIPTTYKTFVGKVHPNNIYSQKQMAVLSSFETSEMILVCPENSDLYHTLLVHAYSPAQVYMINPVQLQILASYSDFVTEYEDVFAKNDGSALLEIINKNKINHVLCSDQHMINFLEKTLINNFSTNQVANWTHININRD